MKIPENSPNFEIILIKKVGGGYSPQDPPVAPCLNISPPKSAYEYL